MFLSTSRKFLIAGIASVSLLTPAAVMAESDFIGGTTPSVRPANAPVIKDATITKEQEKSFFRGVSKPYPPSLLFVKNQGAWYTPFSHPGMTGRYDIRGWH